MSCYLDMKIDISDDKTSIYQTNYLINVLNYFEFNDCKSCKISINLSTVNHVKLFIKQTDKEIIIYYQLTVNSLI